MKLGSLVALLGKHMQSKEEVLDLLLATSVPYLEFTKEMAIPASVCHVKCFDWQLAARVVTYRSVEWMAYSRPCCKRDGGLLSLTWSGFFVPAWILAMFQLYGFRSR